MNSIASTYCNSYAACASFLHRIEPLVLRAFFTVKKLDCNLFFIVRPEAQVNTSAVYLKSTDEEAIIRCRGRGYPPPVVSWFSNGKVIDSNTSSDVHQVYGKEQPEFLEWISTILFVKPDLSLSQFTNYTCIAKNSKSGEKDFEDAEIVRKYLMRLPLYVIFAGQSPQQVPLFRLFVQLLLTKYLIRMF